jgi:predicted acylesterase/phospholipase RssA/CRP-like cAMP-binding protein/MFS family permease
LIAFRVVQGVGAAVLVPASLALVVHGFGPAKRAHGIALWGASAALASGLGPPIGGAIVSNGNWRWAFLVNVPFGIAAILAGRRQLVESRSPGRRRMPDIAGALLFATSLGTLTLALTKASDWRWLDVRTMAALAVSVGALALFIRSSRRHRSPLLDPTLLRNRFFAVGNIATIAAGAGFYAYLLTHILFLHYVWGYSLLRTGLAVAPAAFVAALATPLVSRVAERAGHHVIVVPGALVWAGGLCWYLTHAGRHPDYLVAWLPGQVLQGIGVAMTLPILGNAALSGVPKRGGYATAAAVVTSARQVGGVFGVSLLVILIGTPGAATAFDAFRRGWWLAAACFIAVAVLGLCLRTRPATSPTAEPQTAEPQTAEPQTAEPQTAEPQTANAEYGSRQAVTINRRLDTPDDDERPGAGLSAVAGFDSLDDSSLARLAAAADEVHVAAGEWLFHAGDPGDALYVVQRGRLRVLQGGVVLRELTRGAALGELGLLTQSSRSADVLAVRDTTLLRLSKRRFDAVVDLPMMTELARCMAERVRQIAPPAASQHTTRHRVIALIGVDAQASPAAVLEALRVGTASLAAVDATGCDAAELEAAEATADLVFLRAGHDEGAERDFALRVADRVVLISGTPHSTGSVPDRCLGADVVLTGRPRERDEIRRWQETVRARAIIDATGEDEFRALDELAARLSGRSVGLVLAGGGARALAHIGVLEEFEAAGIRVGRVAGCSVGALIAALSATGISASSVDALMYEHVVRANPSADLTLPTRGLARGRRAAQRLSATMQGRLIEELPKEFRCVSTDLMRRARIVHSSGPVADAVIASLRLPGLYPPYPIGDTLHVDGAILDNMPVDVLAASEGPVIAVDLAVGGSRTRDYEPGVTPPIPRLGETLMRTMLMASAERTRANAKRADIVIRPDTSGIGLLEFHQIDEARAAGAAAARAALPAVRELLAAPPLERATPR